MASEFLKDLDHSLAWPVCRASVEDTMLQQHLVQPDLPHDLEFIGSIFCSKPAWKHEKYVLETYCARDVDVTAQSREALKKLLAQYNLEGVYSLVQVPCAMIAHRMNKIGIRIDPKRVEVVREELLKESEAESVHLPAFLQAQTITKRKRTLAPPGLCTLDRYTNIGPKGKRLKKPKFIPSKPIKYVYHLETQVIHPWKKAAVIMKWLYEDLGLPKQYGVKDESKVTVDKGALEKIERRLREEREGFRIPNAQEVASQLKILRSIKKKGTLLSGFVTEALLTVKRQHPNFNVHGTNSGRWSSSDPNLQNQPETAKYQYVPSDPSYCFINIDFAGIENRLVAFLAGDTARLKRFDIPGFNEHKYAASVFFNVPMDEVEKSSDKTSFYARAKPINHGVGYLEGYKKIARGNDLIPSEVKVLTARWKKEIQPTINWQWMKVGKAKRDGVLTNPFLRKRWFWTEQAATQAAAFTPQSTAYDIIARAMIGLMYKKIHWPEECVRKIMRVYEALPDEAELLLQVHDSLVFECPEHLVKETVRICNKVMTQLWLELKSDTHPDGFGIPIAVEVGAPGASLKECKPYDLSQLEETC